MRVIARVIIHVSCLLVSLNPTLRSVLVTTCFACVRGFTNWMNFFNPSKGVSRIGKCSEQGSKSQRTYFNLKNAQLKQKNQTTKDTRSRDLHSSPKSERGETKIYRGFLFNSKCLFSFSYLHMNIVFDF